MIVDSHAYCFPSIDEPSGHSTSKAHQAWLQVAHAGHHQPAWRVRDRAPASSRPLAPKGFGQIWELPDVQFRADKQRGRVVWTVEKEDYTKQFFPPGLMNMEFTPHCLVAEMDYAGVDVALLHTDPMIGRDSCYLKECVRLYPDRIRSMAPVDEWRIGLETGAVIRELETAISELGLHAIKFMPPLAYLRGEDPWDDGPFRPFWEAATSLGVPVFFTLGTGPSELDPPSSVDVQQQGYLGELEILMRWMERYPDTVCSLTHGFPWRLFVQDNRIQLPETVWQPFQNHRCHLEVSFPVRLGDLFDFPYRELWSTLEELVHRIGAHQLLWGTDMPFQNRFCTYRQSRDWIEKYCGFLSQEEDEAVMGGTASRILGL